MSESLELQLRQRLQEYLTGTITLKELDAHVSLIESDPRASDLHPQQMLTAIRSVFTALKDEPINLTDGDIRRRFSIIEF